MYGAISRSRGYAMSTVVMHNVVSVDGYIADDNDHVGSLFEWYSNGDTELVDGGSFKVSQASADYVRPTWDAIGSMVIGRLWTRWRWMSCRWCSAPASGTSGRLPTSTCWRTPTWSFAGTGCCTCATGSAAEWLDHDLPIVEPNESLDEGSIMSTGETPPSAAPMPDTARQTAGAKVLWHFTMSLDGFVAGPNHAMEHRSRSDLPVNVRYHPVATR